MVIIRESKLTESDGIDISTEEIIFDMECLAKDRRVAFNCFEIEYYAYPDIKVKGNFTVIKGNNCFRVIDTGTKNYIDINVSKLERDALLYRNGVELSYKNAYTINLYFANKDIYNDYFRNRG